MDRKKILVIFKRIDHLNSFMFSFDWWEGEHITGTQENLPQFLGSDFLLTNTLYNSTSQTGALHTVEAM